ncbi:hypothetical protein G6F40_017115 [Rhizopus arrhizus]|nr:hypothetical protein G6F40_017115 [Rhizopus arrhizus]
MAGAGGLQYRRRRLRQMGRRQRARGADLRKERRRANARYLRRPQGAVQPPRAQPGAPRGAARRPRGGVFAAGARARGDARRRLQAGRGGGAAVHAGRRGRHPVPAGQQRRGGAGDRRRGLPQAA